MKITTKGQVTIPLEIREKFGLLPNTEVDFVVDGDGVRLVKAKPRGDSRGRRIIDRLWNTADSGLTTDEIMKLTRG